MWLFVGGTPTNNSLFVGGPPMNYSLFVGGPPTNYSLFVGGPTTIYFYTLSLSRASYRQKVLTWKFDCIVCISLDDVMDVFHLSV